MIFIDKEKIEQYVKEGWVSKNTHPVFPYHIYKYTVQTVIERKWDDITTLCRGLILDDEYNIISKPFPKFFNYEEIKDSIPNTPYEIYTKMDGSLGISYTHNGNIYISTVGNFCSEQSIRATKILREKYYDILTPNLCKNFTFLFEIIYPENRIVVDYEDKEDLVLLAVIRNETGEVVKFDNIGFPQAEKHNITLEEALSQDIKNSEGYVVRHSCGYMYKVKFPTYVMLHKYHTKITNKDIWELLMSGVELVEILEDLPDEVYNKVKEVGYSILEEYKKVETVCKNFLEGKDNLTRKEFAELSLKHNNSNIIFRMKDSKDYSSDVWKSIKPKTQILLFNKCTIE